MKRRCKLVHGCTVYTERALSRQQLSRGASHVTCKYTISVDIKIRTIKRVQSRTQQKHNEPAREQKTALYKSDK